MAKVMNGFLGDAIGKLGNVVFRKWNSMITASQYQPNVKNPNTVTCTLILFSDIWSMKILFVPIIVDFIF